MSTTPKRTIDDATSTLKLVTTFQPNQLPNIVVDTQDFKQALLSDLLALLPEKKIGISEYVDDDGETYYTCKQCGDYDDCDCSGFNEALDQVQKVLEEYCNALS